VLTSPSNLLRVSKQWKSTLESMPALWRHLDLSQARGFVRLGAIQACVDRSRGNIIRATLSRFDNESGMALRYIASRSKRLEYLEIRNGPRTKSLVSSLALAKNLTTLIIGAMREITLDAVAELLWLCKLLARAEFHGVYSSTDPAVWKGDLPQLKTLVLHNRRAKLTPSGRLLSLVGPATHPIE
jgi:F-box/TPR repeat protein Pof3